MRSIKTSCCGLSGFLRMIDSASTSVTSPELSLRSQGGKRRTGVREAKGWQFATLRARGTQAAAMEMALTHNVSAYDARLLVVAAALGSPLLTEDAKLRRAAPLLTRSLPHSLQP